MTYTDRMPPALVRYIAYSSSSTLGVTVQLLNQYIGPIKFKLPLAGD